jgi:hypothetical protein
MPKWQISLEFRVQICDFSKTQAPETQSLNRCDRVLDDVRNAGFSGGSRSKGIGRASGHVTVINTIYSASGYPPGV